MREYFTEKKIGHNLDPVAVCETKGHALTVLTDSGRLEVVDVGELAGPGVWRRVLGRLEAMGIEDRDKILPAWELGLIGQWHY